MQFHSLFLSRHIGVIAVVVPYNFLRIISFSMICMKRQVCLVCNVHPPGFFTDKGIAHQLLKISHSRGGYSKSKEGKKGGYFTWD